MEDGGFNLRKWNTNSQALRDKIEVHELSHEATTNDKSTQEHVSHSIVPAHAYFRRRRIVREIDYWKQCD